MLYYMYSLNKKVGVFMKIAVELARAFNKAVTTPDNINEDGSINWNFVDADVYMAMCDLHGRDKVESNAKDHYEQFDAVAKAYSLSNGIK